MYSERQVYFVFRFVLKNEQWILYILTMIEIVI